MSIKYAEKINKIEKEILKIKKSPPFSKKFIISLKGSLKGVKISEKDINKAEKSLFKKTKISTKIQFGNF